jgi:hypothetical protein
MGHCYHHALSSAKKWGGTAEEFLPLHQWFDEPSKLITADFPHRALRHHAEGIFMLVIWTSKRSLNPALMGLSSIGGSYPNRSRHCLAVCSAVAKPPARAPHMAP